MSSVAERNFATFELGDNVCELAGGLLPEIADKASFELGAIPTEAELRRLIGVLGPAKELQQNIELVRANLGDQADETMADWVERSGILSPLDRRFVRDEAPSEITDSLVMSGGVARWMLRREAVIKSLDHGKIRNIYLPIGNREMKPPEHQMVATWVLRHGHNPSEFEFARDYVVPSLEIAGIRPKSINLLEVESSDGDEILDTLFTEYPRILDRTVKVVSNAPNGLQASGQLRLAARRLNPVFDGLDNGQLSVTTDAFPLARKGEKPATHQNPVTALGQLARNALFLHLNASK